MDDYVFVSGINYGLPKSTIVHRLANIAGKITCGENCRIDAFVTITGKVKIGSNTHIATGACIFGGEGVTIGDGCSLSPGSKIFTATDDTDSDGLANPLLKNRRYKHGPVSIGDFSVVGSNAVVLPNSVIGDEVQIGANAVVRGNIPSNQVWVGLPAKYLKERAPLNRSEMMGFEIPANTGA